MHTLNPLTVTTDSLQAIQHWPLELRALLNVKPETLAKLQEAEKKTGKASGKKRS